MPHTAAPSASPLATPLATPSATPLAPDALPAFAAQALAELRAQTPLVQCITNTVVANFTANVLLALGAAPAMVNTPGEAGPFAGMASALLINLGSPVPAQADAVREAVAGAKAAGTPWVLDPVAVGALPVRTALAYELLALQPNAIRGNASEVLALAGAGAGGRGVDATNTVAQAEQAAMELAGRLHGGSGVVAVSGAVDFLTNGKQESGKEESGNRHSALRLANGTKLLTQVTGGGCALGGVLAAFLALAPKNPTPAPTPQHLELAAAAVLVYTIAAELAAAAITQQGLGPGSFAVRLIDQLALLQPGDVLRHARVQA